MAAAALPPPGGMNDPGSSVSPAPPVMDTGAMQKLELIRTIVSATNRLGQMVPGAVPIVRQINDLAQQLQMKIIQSGPLPEPQAPPV